MDVKLPDGTIVQNVPDGITQSELMARVQKSQAPVKQPPQGDSMLKKLAPGYMGPAGGFRMWQEGIHPMQLLDKAAYEGGGKVTDLATQAGAPPEVAAGVGTATNLGIGSIPSVAGGATARAIPALQNLGRGLMKHAIGPTITDTLKGKVEPAVSTFLNEGLNPTAGGLEQLAQKVKDLKQAQSAITDQSNKVISLAEPAKNLSALEQKVMGSTTGVEDAGTVRKMRDVLFAHPNVDEAGLMSVQNAQRMKEMNHAKMGDAAYGAGLKPAAERDAIKAATAGLRVALEGAEPGVVPLNAKMAELMNAIKVSERHVAGESNRSLLPMGASFATATHNPAAAAGMYGVSNSYIQALVARMLHKLGSEEVQKGAGAATGAALGAYSGTAPGNSQALSEALRRKLGEN